MATYVLVPGAWLGAWVWKRITPILRGEGHEVFTVTLTGMGDRFHLGDSEKGIETAIEDVIKVIEFEGLNDVILVGHSFAGKIVAAVADRIPERIRLLFFLDAVRPRKSRETQGGMEEWPEETRNQILEECKANGDGWKWPLPDSIMESVGYDIQGKDKEWMMSKVTPIPIKLFGGSIKLSPSYDSLKRAYLYCTGGGANIEELKKEVLDGPLKIMECGHWPMINKPEELARNMLELSS